MKKLMLLTLLAVAASMADVSGDFINQTDPLDNQYHPKDPPDVPEPGTVVLLIGGTVLIAGAKLYKHYAGRV